LPLSRDVQEEDGHPHPTVDDSSKLEPTAGGSMMTGNGKGTALRKDPSITAPSNISDSFQAQAPTQSAQPSNTQELSPSDM